MSVWPPEASGSGLQRVVAVPAPTPNPFSTESVRVVPARKGKKGKGKALEPVVRSELRRTTCEAIDRWEEDCSEIVLNEKGKPTRRYCDIHEAESDTLRQEYERCLTALLEFTPHHPDFDPVNIRQQHDLQVLAASESLAQEQLHLVDKAIRTREYYTTHFTNDWGQTEFDFQRLADEFEHASTALNQRAHELIIESEDAHWLLPTPDDLAEPKYPPCTSATTSSLPPPCAPALQTESEEPDPVEAIERVTRLELLECLSLVGSHASFIRDERTSVERVRIIECLFRRLISRDPTLLVRAFRGGHDHVLRFFEDPTCCTLKELDRLWADLQKTSVEQIAEAIQDAFRAIEWEESGAGETEEGEDGAGLQLLGGWIYKLEIKRERRMNEWDHLYALCGCPGCALRCCRTFSEWARFRRLTVVPHGNRPPPYLYWGEQKETDAGKIFRALDVVKCCEDRMADPEVRRVGGGFVGAKGKGVFVERQERNWLFIKLSVNNPRALRFITALANTHVVLAQDRRDSDVPIPSIPLPPLTHLWYSRHRSATAKASLRHQAWLIDPEGFSPSLFASVNALDSPEVQQRMEPFADTFEVLVMDGFGRTGEGSGFTPGDYVGRSWEQFEAVVADILLQVSGLANVAASIQFGERESYRLGDLLFDFKGIGEEFSQLREGKLGSGGGGKKKSKESDSLRDDDLAFKLSRSLFGR